MPNSEGKWGLSYRIPLYPLPFLGVPGLSKRNGGMIGPMYGKSGQEYSGFRIFFSDFHIIPSSYPQGMIPGYDWGMIGPMYQFNLSTFNQLLDY